MSRRLLVLNVVLAIVSVALAAGIVRTMIAKRALPAPAGPRAAAVSGPVAATATADPGLSSYAVIAARNLFNPGRNETAVSTAAVAKPILHGVVVDGAKSRAFLEDPAAKRIVGYSVGDMIGGGRIQAISDDRVAIAMPEGLLEVLLRDPAKPRPTPVTAAPGQAPTATTTPPSEGPSQAAPPVPVRTRRASAPDASAPSGGAPGGGNRFYFGDSPRSN